MTGGAPNTLLIVDDDRAFRAMLGWAFEDLGYHVSVACCCGDALEQASENRFDYALVDFGLPDGDGHTLSKRLRSEQPALGVILMSADSAGALTCIGERRMGMVVMQKPFPPDQVDALFRDGKAQGDERPNRRESL